MLSGKTLDDLYSELSECNKSSIKYYVINKTINNKLKALKNKPRMVYAKAESVMHQSTPQQNITNNKINNKVDEIDINDIGDISVLIEDANKSLLNLLDENELDELDELSFDSFNSETSGKSFLKDQKFAKAIEKDTMNRNLFNRFNNERDIKNNKTKQKLQAPYSQDESTGGYAKA